MDDDDTKQFFELLQQASLSLLKLTTREIDQTLEAIAKETELKTFYILSENQKDLQQIDKEDPLYQQLLLTEEDIKTIAQNIRKTTQELTPVFNITEDTIAENEIRIIRQNSPFGIINIPFKTKPNICFELFSKCFKTNNVTIFSGGAETKFTNRAINEIIREVLDENGINPNICILLNDPKEYIDKLPDWQKHINLILPFGDNPFLAYIQEKIIQQPEQKIQQNPQIYFHTEGDIEKGIKIITNIDKGVNSLLIDKERLEDLSKLCKELIEKNIKIIADKTAYQLLNNIYPNNTFEASEENEKNKTNILYIKTINNMNDAIEYISENRTKENQLIITENKKSAQQFAKLINSNYTYINIYPTQLDVKENINTIQKSLVAPNNFQEVSLQHLCNNKCIITEA